MPRTLLSLSLSLMPTFSCDLRKFKVDQQFNQQAWSFSQRKSQKVKKRSWWICLSRQQFFEAFNHGRRDSHRVKVKFYVRKDLITIYFCLLFLFGDASGKVDPESLSKIESRSQTTSRVTTFCECYPFYKVLSKLH